MRIRGGTEKPHRQACPECVEGDAKGAKEKKKLYREENNNKNRSKTQPAKDRAKGGIQGTPQVQSLITNHHSLGS
jgi:hypothetical protein